MSDDWLAVGRKKEKPSPLYASEKDGGHLLTGELDELMGSGYLRDAAVRWAGIEAELRPRERARVAARLEKLREIITGAMCLTDEIFLALVDLNDELRESEREQ